jgi:hypothetical protein
MEGYPGRKPFFDMARGAAETTLLTVPPFSFPGVTARVFPLRASMDLLSAFCRRYLNVAPPEICELRPYLPFVLLVVLDYGQGAVETANLGWLSQHEIFFAVPLERWHRRRGRMVFDGWVLNTPFIFVDNASSLTTGREVYGWPKVLAALRPSMEEWLVDPRSPTQLLSLSVKGFGNRDAEKVPLLKIDQGLEQNPSLAPADLAAANPFHRLSRLARNASQAGVDLATLLLRSPLSGFGPRPADSESRAEVLFASLRQLFDFTRNPGVDVMTLKQFRDARHSDDVCYQALVRSRLVVDRFNHGGPLGLYNLLQGDASGGFRIRLYDHPSFPIVSALGLQTVRQQTDCGRTVSTVEPFCPCWLSVDLTYGRGENLGWRMHGSPWYGKDAEIVGSASSSYGYNTVAGAGQQEWVGPYAIPTSSHEVFPLRVYDERRLERFILGYLNLGEPHSFKRWGSHVYLVASRSRVFSQARSALCSQIAVYVPLLWHEQGRLRGVVMANPYAFVDDPTFAMTMREVQGVPAVDATIETPVQSWLRRGPVLRMKTEVFTVLDAGMGAERRTLIEVMPPPSAGSSPSSGGPAADDRGGLLEQAQTVFGVPVKVPVLTLKQFRDAREPDLACYQALILEPWTLFGALPQRLGAGTQIRIYRYPSLPLAKTLGLVDPAQPPLQSSRKKRRAMVDVLTPEDPFRIDLDITIGLAEVLSRTAGNLPWVQPKKKEGVATPEQEVEHEARRKIIQEILHEGPQAVIAALLQRASAAGSVPGGGGDVR